MRKNRRSRAFGGDRHLATTKVGSEEVSGRTKDLHNQKGIAGGLIE